LVKRCSSVLFLRAVVFEKYNVESSRKCDKEDVAKLNAKVKAVRFG